MRLALACLSLNVESYFAMWRLVFLPTVEPWTCVKAALARRPPGRADLARR